MSVLSLLGLALVLVAIVMGIVWWTSVRIRNAGIVDIAWSANFALLALLYAACGEGWEVRRGLVLALGGLQSIRLASYLYRRVMGHHPEEDGRYRELRESWGGNVELKFLAFFQFQGVTNVLLSLPFAIAAANPSPALHPLEILGVVLWTIGFAGEAIADRQLDAFRRDPANRGRTCRVGLWRLSRHPNYFFEWLVWVAYFVFASGSPWGFVTVYCPAVMLWFLFRVTGIPATEAHALRSRGEEYREYQRTTSAFVPWFPRG
jgi:steroid 5-alpha reductase family enzyme